LCCFGCICEYGGIRWTGRRFVDNTVRSSAYRASPSITWVLSRRERSRHLQAAQLVFQIGTNTVCSTSLHIQSCRLGAEPSSRSSVGPEDPKQTRAEPPFLVFLNRAMNGAPSSLSATVFDPLHVLWCCRAAPFSALLNRLVLLCFRLSAYLVPHARPPGRLRTNVRAHPRLAKSRRFYLRPAFYL
jgi:hypothetical protein